MTDAEKQPARTVKRYSQAESLRLIRSARLAAVQAVERGLRDPAKFRASLKEIERHRDVRLDRLVIVD